MSPGLPRVVVCLGTDHHPFDRLVGWCVDLAAEGWATWFIQHGHTPAPRPGPGIEAVPLLGVAELQARMRAAAAVVTHGGPGLIVDAHLAGHRPVVVARDPALGEHVDSHQLRFVRRLGAVDPGAGSLHSLTQADTLDGLRQAVRQAFLTPVVALDPDGATGHPAGGPADRFGTLVARMMER